MALFDRLQLNAFVRQRHFGFSDDRTLAQVRPPLIVDEHGDLELFRDGPAMESYLEAIDVQNREYVVYDSEGRQVELATAEVPTRSFFGLLRGSAEVVRIASVEAEPTHALELSTKLRSHLERFQESIPPEATLSDLVERLRNNAGFVA